MRAKTGAPKIFPNPVIFKKVASGGRIVKVRLYAKWSNNCASTLTPPWEKPAEIQLFTSYRGVTKFMVFPLKKGKCYAEFFTRNGEAATLHVIVK